MQNKFLANVISQWLVKKAMETRESLNDHLRKIADLQYQKTFPMPDSEVKLKETAKHLPTVFLPQRKFKKVQGRSLPIEKEVNTVKKSFAIYQPLCFI